MTANPAMRATMAGKDSLDSGANDLRVTGARQAKHHEKTRASIVFMFLKPPVEEFQIAIKKYNVVLPPILRANQSNQSYQRKRCAAKRNVPLFSLVCICWIYAVASLRWGA